MHTIVVPTEVILPRKTKKDKKFILNLNNYRNGHFRILNESKQKFEKKMDELNPNGISTPNIPFPWFFEYQFYLRQRSDIANVGAIVDKYMSDYLVNIGVLPDDYSDYVNPVIYRFIDYNKNPYGILLIRSAYILTEYLDSC